MGTLDYEPTYYVLLRASGGKYRVDCKTHYSKKELEEYFKRSRRNKELEERLRAYSPALEQVSEIFKWLVEESPLTVSLRDKPIAEAYRRKAKFYFDDYSASLDRALALPDLVSYEYLSSELYEIYLFTKNTLALFPHFTDLDFNENFQKIESIQQFSAWRGKSSHIFTIGEHHLSYDLVSGPFSKFLLSVLEILAAKGLILPEKFIAAYPKYSLMSEAGFVSWVQKEIPEISWVSISV